MTQFVVNVLLVLAAASLGLRATGLLIAAAPPWLRLAASLVIGGILVATAMQISDRYQVHDLGLGLLVSLAPVGVYDLVKWWLRRKRKEYAVVSHD